MTPKDDDIPDLFSEAAQAPSARRVEPSRSVPPGPHARPVEPSRSVPPGPAAPVLRPSIPPSALPSSGLSLDLAIDEPSDAIDAEADEDEFDLLAATSARGDGFGLAAPAPARQVVSPAPARQVVSPRASSPELLAVQGPKRSSYPPPMSASAAPPVSAPPAGNLPSGLESGGVFEGGHVFEGGNVLDWDLDEALGLAPAADLIVATTVPTRGDDDGPWPEARTPDPSEHSISFEEAQQLAAFGPTPSGALASPLYFIRVVAGRDRVRALVRDAEQRLAVVEAKRDARVAELGESLRGSLEGQERFAELYSQIARYDELIQARERDWGAVDQKGAAYFAEQARKLDEAKKATAAALAAVTERRLIAEEAARAVSRARALVSRFEIEKRNVEELAKKRPAEGGFMPADLAARYQYLEKDLADAQQKLGQSEVEQSSQRQLLRQIEDAHRQATATEQRFEGEREGFLLAHEGTLSDHASLLDEARRGRIAQMAHAGRVVLELRGEVKVAREIREEIQALDREVKGAARAAELARRAAGTLDARAFSQGRNFWIALGVAFVLFLLWGILR